MPTRPVSAFSRYAWLVLGYNLLVILWGAFVRATGSGAGCGKHWPLCNGEVVPVSPAMETLIELAHRITSGLAGVLVMGLFFWAFRAYAKGSLVRLGATLSLVFVITEGLLGAALVLFEWVGEDASLGRVISIALHLNNTFILVAMLTLTAWWASGGRAFRFKGHGRSGWLAALGLIALLVVSTAGAITALGDTLFKVDTLAEGLQRDFSSAAHFLERLRIWHPVLALVSWVFLFTSTRYLSSLRPTPVIHRLQIALMGLLFSQVLLGLVNVYLLAPVWLQLLHLLVADLIWIIMVLFTAALLAEPDPGLSQPALTLAPSTPSF